MNKISDSAKTLLDYDKTYLGKRKILPNINVFEIPKELQIQTILKNLKLIRCPEMPLFLVLFGPPLQNRLNNVDK